MEDWFLIILVVIQILLLIFMKKKNRKFIYIITSGIITILIFIIASYLERMTHLNSPGLGEIGAGLITGGFRVISIILFTITLFSLIKNFERNLNSKGKKSFEPIVLFSGVFIIIVSTIITIYQINYILKFEKTTAEIIGFENNRTIVKYIINDKEYENTLWLSYANQNTNKIGDEITMYYEKSNKSISNSKVEFDYITIISLGIGVAIIIYRFKDEFFYRNNI